MAQYLTVESFTALAICPSEYIDYIEVQQAGWVDGQLTWWSGYIDSRLAKRYATPFAENDPPIVVQGWLARLVTPNIYLKRGVDVTDGQIQAVRDEADAAKSEIAEAANSKDGLYELPLRQSDPSGQGITRGGPLAYTETSPYVWQDQQESIGRGEDRNGSG
jgi:hypothetical protein